MSAVADAHAVETFCRERAESMRHGWTAAIYVGLADRLKRGFFDAAALDDVNLSGVLPVVVRCRRCGVAFGEIVEVVPLSAIVEAAVAHADEAHPREVASWS